MRSPSDGSSPSAFAAREVLLKDWLLSYQRDHVVGRLRNVVNYATFATRWVEVLGNRPLRHILPGDIAR